MSDPFIGQVTAFGFYFQPRGWQLCQGQILSIASNTVLFSLLGTTYGGNGQTTFGLPDLRGRTIVGQGQGPGLQSYVMGQMSGTETVTILSTQMPMHTHTLPAGGGGTKASIQAGTESVPGTNGAVTLAVPSDSDTRAAVNLYNNDAAPTVTLTGSGSAGGQTGIAGGSQPVGIMQPYLTLNYSIAIYGIFPSRD